MKLETLVERYDYSVNSETNLIWIELWLNDYTPVRLSPSLIDSNGYDIESDKITLFKSELEELTITLFNLNSPSERMFIYPSYKELNNQFIEWLK